MQDAGGAFRLASTADFILAGAQEGAFARIFRDIHYATADSDARALTAPAATSFSAGLERMYVVFNWERIRPGTLYTVRWLVDGDPFFEQTLPWAGAESGDGFLLRLVSNTGIPDGTYSVELLVSRILFASQSVRVGIGQLPIDRFAEAVGVQLQGRIFDADTGVGISGATFVVITEEFSAADFTRDWLQTQVYAIAVTDRSGRFFIDRPLLSAVPYSVHITAQGYLPISADAFRVSDAAGTLDLPIFMTRG